jgi:uncharacterized protein YfaQ (DUF2300 family)
VYFAFDNEADAQKFSAAVKAEATGAYAGWASHWAFELDSARLKKALAVYVADRDRLLKELPDR